MSVKSGSVNELTPFQGKRLLQQANIPLTPYQARCLFEVAMHVKGSLEEWNKLVLPDVSTYNGKILVKICIDFYRGGSHSEQTLLTRGELTLLEHFDAVVNFGEVNGKHSEVMRNWSDLNVEEQEDPYEIFQELRGRDATSYAIENALEPYTEGDEGGEGDEFVTSLFKDMCTVGIERKIGTQKTETVELILKKEEVEWLKEEEKKKESLDGWKITHVNSEGCKWKLFHQRGDDNDSDYGPLEKLFKQRISKKRKNAAP